MMQNELNTAATAETTPGVVRFPLGQTFITRGALDALTEAGQSAAEFLRRHQRGDWGDLCREDKRENEFSVPRHLRILSKYHTAEGTPLYVITEADRSATTILRVDEY
jgi:hypothetical protein